MVQSTFDVVVGGKRRPLSMPVMMSLILQSLAGNLPTCRDMSPTTHRVAPILARWVRVADTIFSMSWQFVSARADIY